MKGRLKKKLNKSRILKILDTVSASSGDVLFIRTDLEKCRGYNIEILMWLSQKLADKNITSWIIPDYMSIQKFTKDYKDSAIEALENVIAELKEENNDNVNI